MLKRLRQRQRSSSAAADQPWRLKSELQPLKMFAAVRLSLAERTASLMHSEYILEVLGSRCCLVRVPHVKKSAIAAAAVRCELTSTSLKHALSRLQYSGQSMTLLLHAASVSTKLFDVQYLSPDEFVLRNLQDICPPGDRDSMVLRYCSLDERTVITAVTSRAQMRELQQLLETAGIRVTAIFPAAAIAASLFNQSEEESLIPFALMPYRCYRSAGLLHARSTEVIESENRCDDPPQVDPTNRGSDRFLETLEAYSMRVREQKGLPSLNLLPASRQKFSVKVEQLLNKSVMTAGRVALSLIAVLLMSAVARTAYTSLTEGDPGSILRYESELRTAEQTSARLTAEVTEVRASGRVRDGTISRIMSLIPSHLKEEHWLEQLTVSRPNPERPGTASFKFTGYSLDIADLLKATATLTESGAVLSASVAQTTKVRRPAVISNLISEDELDHFEVYGETR